MVRRYAVIVAAAGFVGLLAWWLYGLRYDVEVLRQLDREEVFGLSPSVWLALRFSLPLASMVLAGLALVQTFRGRHARPWFVAVVAVLVEPLIWTSHPLRLTLLPYYIPAALYLLLALGQEGRRAG